MRPHIYWIDAPRVGRLAVVSRPDPTYGLVEQMRALREDGLDTLVSLLAATEAAAVGLADEAIAARSAGLAFDTLPTTDFAVPPSFSEAAEVIGRVAGDLGAGRAVGAHCYAGRGRSPLFIAAVLVHRGYQPDHAIEAVSAGRGRSIPETAAQRRWIADFAVWLRDTQNH